MSVSFVEVKGREPFSRSSDRALMYNCDLENLAVITALTGYEPGRDVKPY